MILVIIHLVQSALAAYGGLRSYAAINNLLKYENAAKKASRFSNEAARQLHKTRTTQASGAIALVLSLCASLNLAASGWVFGMLPRYLSSPAMLAVVFLARKHMQEYWAAKDGKTVGTEIPLPKMDQYNEAQGETEELLKVLGWLAVSWAGTSLVAFVDGY
ncbi:hypothetical protein F5X99DRAFT_328987 [Biscogniauxia marginata]|nr:hypothetical protein F5X99DRAFT_328987 [Biscogniauxia marginata]